MKKFIEWLKRQFSPKCTMCGKIIEKDEGIISPYGYSYCFGCIKKKIIK